MSLRKSLVICLLVFLHSRSAAPVMLTHESADICSEQSQFTGSQRAIACYAGFFLVKMLTELSNGQNKTAEHVHVHLLPYLGGEAALSALRSESPSDASCRICYSDPATANGLSELRAAVPEEQRDAYDALHPCYQQLTHRIINRLPVDDAGVWLLRQPGFTPQQQAAVLFKQLFSSKYFDVRSCRLSNN